MTATLEPKVYLLSKLEFLKLFWLLQPFLTKKVNVLIVNLVNQKKKSWATLRNKSNINIWPKTNDWTFTFLMYNDLLLSKSLSFSRQSKGSNECLVVVKKSNYFCTQQIFDIFTKIILLSNFDLTHLILLVHPAQSFMFHEISRFFG